MVGVAVKITAVPEQTVVLFATIETEGVTGVPKTTLVALEVKEHPVAVTVTVYAPEVVAVYVPLVAPAIATPSLFHW